MEVENEKKDENNNIRSNNLSLLKERKYELNNACDEVLNLINTSKNLLFSKLSEKQKNNNNKPKQYEYWNYINYKICELSKLEKKINFY